MYDFTTCFLWETTYNQLQIVLSILIWSSNFNLNLWLGNYQEWFISYDPIAIICFLLISGNWIHFLIKESGYKNYVSLSTFHWIRPLKKNLYVQFRVIPHHPKLLKQKSLCIYYLFPKSPKHFNIRVISRVSLDLGTACVLYLYIFYPSWQLSIL